MVENGRPCVVGVYFGSKVEVINYRDKKTGQAASFSKQTHTVILGQQPAVVSERIPDGVNAKQLEADLLAGKFPFKSGSRVLIEVKGVTESRGHIDIEAHKLHAFEAA